MVFVWNSDSGLPYINIYCNLQCIWWVFSGFSEYCIVKSGILKIIGYFLYMAYHKGLRLRFVNKSLLSVSTLHFGTSVVLGLPHR